MSPPVPVPKFERREVASPLTRGMLAPMTAPQGVVQFASRLSDEDFARLGTWFADHPHVELRAYASYDGTITDLEFLRFFPGLRSFSADALFDSLESLDGLRHLSEHLEELVIGRTRRRLDLAVLERFTGLGTLLVEGQTRHLEVVSRLTTLEDLTLRSVTLPDLSLLLPLKRLRALALKLGGTKNLGLLARIGRLEYLELWLIRGLEDVSAIAGIRSLRHLFLQALRRVEALPDLGRLPALRRVHLETMKGLRDLRPVAAAPGLQDLLLVDMPQLRVDDLRCFVGHPSLRAAGLGLGSDRRNDAARALLGLPTPEVVPDWRDL